MKVKNPWSIGTVDDIQFELRKRKRVRQDFWSIKYNINTGQIVSIEAGNKLLPDHIVVSYARVKDILAGKLNQNDYRVKLNENLGALDLVDIKRPTDFKKKHTWVGWLSAGESTASIFSPLKIILFVETGILRVEASREWSTSLRETMNRQSDLNDIPFFISDIEDPHQLLGHDKIKLSDIIERGYWERRLWAFMDHDNVQRLLYQGLQMRINMPPVASNLSLIRINQFSPFSGIIDESSIISHRGPGKHISVFIKDGGIWAQSHYEKGNAIDHLTGNLRVAVVKGDDPEDFITWAEMPALMLRQHHPFEILPNWQYQARPNLLYKANNLDIGVLN
jgi:hypothetical protein